MMGTIRELLLEIAGLNKTLTPFYTLPNSQKIYSSSLLLMKELLTKSARPYNFYSLLKTYEDALGLSSLNKNDMDAQLIDDVWKK